MKGYKILALDETGKASLSHHSKNFILSGIIIPESYKPRLKLLMCKLKNKYFGNEDLVFHCRDMLRKKGPFALLREDLEKEMRFWAEFTTILNSEKISLAFVITDKMKAKKLGWNEVAILRKAYNKMLEEFVKNHLDTDNGKIVVESDPSQDKYLIEAHARLQGVGIPSEGITGSNYREKITSLSLVNKLNLDDDIQIADSLAIMASIVYEMKIGGLRKTTKIEKMMVRLIERKMSGDLGIFEVLV
ncbi:MAG: hypothetical protein PHH40_01625 [Candidatus Moranbacteria bacterium]|nr:hypothetical protein [Candidatus Moranbacteria bacterium]MDD3965080.1 hypothetical protein [Candidatus Moranbacteria bacterium]